jgi:predicted DNA-binding transcriptional regulator
MENERYFRSQTEEEIKEFDELQAKKDEIILLLKSGDIEGAVKIQQEFCVPAEMITELSDIYGIIEQSILNELIQGEFKKIGAIKDSFLISDEDIAQIAEKAILFSIVEKDIAIAKQIQQEFALSDEIVQEAAKEGFIYSLKNRNIRFAKQIQQEFSISDDIIQSPEVQEAVKEGFIYELQRGDMRSAKEIQQEFSISDEIIQSPEVQEAVKEGFIYELQRGDIRAAKEIQQEFSISDDIVQEAAREGFIDGLKRGWYIYKAKQIQQEFSISDDIIQSPEVQEAVKEGFIYELQRGDMRSAKEIQQEFSISDEIIQSPEVQEAVKEGFIHKLRRGDIRVVQQIQQEFALSDEIVQEAAKEGFIYSLKNRNIGFAKQIQQEFALSDEMVQEAARKGFIENLKDGNITQGLDLLNAFRINLTSFETRAIEIFATFLNYNIFLEISDLEKGVIGPELKKLGVTSAGERGVQEVLDITSRLKSEFVQHNPERIDFENSNFMTSYFMAYTGYKSSEWGETNQDSFINSIDNTRNIKYRPLPEGFYEVETYQVLKKEKSSNIDRSIYREDFLNRFSILLDDIKEAKANLEYKKPLSRIVEHLNLEIEEIVTNLKNKSLELQDNPQAQINLNRRIELLENMDLRSVQDFQDNFKTLSSFSELDSILRRVVFSMGFAKNRVQLERSLDSISLESPSLDDVSWVINFVDHITNQETMANYFTDKKAKKKFEEKINPTALIEQIELLQKGQITSGSTDITFSTHRDFHTEISGQVADACWASKYTSILTEFPNFSSLLMVKDKESKYEKIMGSGLLIEAKAENGDDLLIIRGLNPRENIINGLDIESYFEAIVDYTKKLATNTGKKLAISIDDHSGGHTTNRPVLFNYISNLTINLTPVRLLDPNESEFNGYNLQGDVYLL